jgi:hypothetical protein
VPFFKEEKEVGRDADRPIHVQVSQVGKRRQQPTAHELINHPVRRKRRSAV